MKINSFTGEPAEPGMLVNTPRLVSTYYTGIPDPSIDAQLVSFGTSGYRGGSYKNICNENHMLAITQAICIYRKAQKINGPLNLGFDIHALSAPAFAASMEVLAANEIKVMIAIGGEYLPTPAISYAILKYNAGRKTGLADGIVITASHNPPGDGGFKYDPHDGGTAGNDATNRIEAKANELMRDKLMQVKRISLQKALHAATTHRYDFLTAFVNDLGNIIDMELIRHSKIKIGVDQLGDAGVHYWVSIAERYKLDLTVTNKTVDPTFSFMTVDRDGQICMDPSSAYAMQRSIAMKDDFDFSFTCDTDRDRHGIVTKTAGLQNPNHYLSVAVFYLLQHLPLWNKNAAVGKTAVTTQLIDRIAAKFNRKIYDVPVGFRWFVDGLLHASLCFGGEQSAKASFSRLDETVWTTDKDGFIPALLSAEITAKLGKDPGEIYRELKTAFGEPFYDRIETKATPEQKEKLKKNFQLNKLNIQNWPAKKLKLYLRIHRQTMRQLGALK